MVRLVGRGRFALSLLWLVLLVGFAIRLALMPVPGFDVKDFQLWSKVIAENGLAQAYDQHIYPEINYPPVSLYLFWVIGKTQMLLSSSTDELKISPVLLKLLPILADAVTIVAMLAFLGKQGAVARSQLPVWLGFYALNPAIIWNSAYWGGIDALDALFTILALIFLVERRTVLAWAFAVLAVLTKPLAAPVLVPVVWITATRERRRPLLEGIIAGAATTIVLYLPWLVDSRIGSVIEALRKNVGNYPYLSANAHNFWWLVSGGDGWHPDNWPLPLVNFRVLGAIAVALAACWTIRCLPPDAATPQVFHASAYLLMALPVLSTEAHENWVFAAFAPLSVACVFEPRLRMVLSLSSMTFLINLASHDPGLEAALKHLVPASLFFSVRLANALIATLVFAYWTTRLPSWFRARQWHISCASNLR